MEEDNLELSEINKKIEETVNYGSVGLALEKKYFSGEELMEWISKNERNDFVDIAYIALCACIHPNKQYLENGKHLLSAKPEFLDIAIYVPGFNESIPSTRDGDDELINVVVDCYFYIYQNGIYNKLAELLLLKRIEKGHKFELDKIYKMRHFPVPYISPNEVNENLLKADWVEKLRYNDNCASLVLERISFLIENCPSYYEGVVMKEYHDVAIKLNKEKLLYKLSVEELSKFNSYYPGIINPNIFNYDNLCYKICLMPNDLAGYYLGFPIQNFIPNDQQIENALNVLNVEKKEQYAKRIKNYIKSTYSLALPFEYEEPTMANDFDAITEDPDDYAPFDILALQYGNHVYRFTRPEFKDISEKKKNYWTGEWLPESFLSNVLIRTKISKEMGLPLAETYLTLLENLENNKCENVLTEEDDQDLSIDEEDPNDRVAGAILALLSQQLFNPIVD